MASSFQAASLDEKSSSKTTHNDLKSRACQIIHGQREHGVSLTEEAPLLMAPTCQLYQ